MIFIDWAIKGWLSFARGIYPFYSVSDIQQKFQLTAALQRMSSVRPIKAHTKNVNCPAICLC